MSVFKSDVRLTFRETYTLHDDESNRTKETVMTKYEILMDDSRNPDTDFAEQVEEFLKFGETYTITYIIQKV